MVKIIMKPPSALNGSFEKPGRDVHNFQNISKEAQAGTQQYGCSGFQQAMSPVYGVLQAVFSEKIPDTMPATDRVAGGLPFRWR